MTGRSFARGPVQTHEADLARSILRGGRGRNAAESDARCHQECRGPRAVCWLILGTGLVPAFAQPAEEAHKRLLGAWTATQAERDGKAADDVVGHRLSLTGNRFRIQSKDGKPLYTGTVRVDPRAKPAAIDFEHTEGTLKGEAWKRIYALEGDTLTMCDNAPNLDKGRPAAFEARAAPGISSSRSSARSPEPQWSEDFTPESSSRSQWISG
jgi:uncharacterized protein (TIGR03067 family)